MMPIERETITDDPYHKRIQLHQRLSTWAHFNRHLIGQPDALLASETRATLQKVCDAWRESYLIDYLDEPTTQMLIFVELARSHYLLLYQELREEQRDINERHGIPNEERNYLLLQTLHVEGDPIIKFKQSQLMETLMAISERLCFMTHDEVEQLRTWNKLLLARHGMLLCHGTSGTVLDVENMRDSLDDDQWRPNSDYLMFASIYHRHIARRLFLLDAFPVGRLEISPARREAVRQWCEQEACNGLGSEGFEQTYRKMCDEAYNVPGDIEWFRHRNPNAPLHRGAILDCLRKPLAVRYFSEYRVSRDTVMATMTHMDQQGHCSRALLLSAIDQYMQAQYHLEWKSGMLIANEFIEHCQQKLYREKTPYLIEAFSHYEVYYDKHLYHSDDIYETLAIWFTLADRHFGGVLLGFDIGPTCRALCR